MDYRYETNDSARDFHRQRRAFVIYHNKVEFLPQNSPMSHFEYCQTLGIDKIEFNSLTRGFYLGGKLIFYKDNFVYDDAVIIEALKYIKELAVELNQNQFDIYFGQLPQDNFKPDYYYGRYQNGLVTKVE